MKQKKPFTANIPSEQEVHAAAARYGKRLAIKYIALVVGIMTIMLILGWSSSQTQRDPVLAFIGHLSMTVVLCIVVSIFLMVRAFFLLKFALVAGLAAREKAIRNSPIAATEVEPGVESAEGVQSASISAPSKPVKSPYALSAPDKPFSSSFFNGSSQPRRSSRAMRTAHP